MGKKYLLYYAIAHAEFRYPELQSISELFNFGVGLPEEEEERDPNRPFLIVELEDESHAHHLAQRCILIRCEYAPYLSFGTLMPHQSSIRTLGNCDYIRRSPRADTDQ